MSEFGNALRELRTKAGLSRQKVAELSNISPPAIAAYESGGKIPSFTYAIKIADAFGVSLDYLAGREVGKGLESYGDIARRLYELIETNELAVTKCNGDVCIALNRPSQLENFLTNFQRKDTIPQDIFDGWLKSELESLDEKPLPGFANAESEGADGEKSG